MVDAYVNDPRGTEHTANVEAERVMLRGTLSIVCYVAKRDIAEGAELLIDYGAHYSMEMHPRPWTQEWDLIDVDAIPVNVKRESGVDIEKLTIRCARFPTEHGAQIVIRSSSWAGHHAMSAGQDL